MDKTEDVEILFRRGFFGKGTLSRSEPTWRARRIDMIKGGECESTFPSPPFLSASCGRGSACEVCGIDCLAVAAEKIREKRRLERKQFKIDRAAAMLDAAKAAEAVITTGQAPSSHCPPQDDPREEEEEDERDQGLGEGEGDEEDIASPATTTISTPGVIDINTLTPQTFLVRPTRPDANRNRGRNAFKRKLKPKPTSTVPTLPLPTDSVPIDVPSQAQPATGLTGTNVDPNSEAVSAGVQSIVSDAPGVVDEDEFDERLVEELEHLQLSLEEAWFLSTALGVLKIHDPVTVSASYIGPKYTNSQAGQNLGQFFRLVILPLPSFGSITAPKRPCDAAPPG